MSPGWRGRAHRLTVGAIVLGVIVAAGAGSTRLAAQEDTAEQTGGGALRVFLDCASRNCDRTHFRREITFVNWVREPQDAQLHVIMTSERAGGGGFRYTLDFSGRENLEGLTDQYTHTSSVTDVRDEVVDALTQVLRLGLVRFAAQGGFGEDVRVRAADAGEESAGVRSQVVTPEDDPWDFWVFRVNANASVDDEERQSSTNWGFGFSANRTTELWKIELETDGSFRRSEFELEDTTITNDQDRWSVSALAVRSLREHWGVGLELEADNSTRLNRDLLVAVGGGVEYNYFPYSESTRRVLLARYVVSAERVDYDEITQFEVLEETVYKHEVGIDWNAREEWGNAFVGADATQFLDRPEAYSVGFGGRIDYRILRGLSVNVGGRYELVRDQIYLPLATLSDEDILLGRRRLPTDSSVSFNLGLRYSFGSIFNNAVNTRFRRGVR